MGDCFGTDQSSQAFAIWAKKRDIFLHPDVAFLVPTKTMGLGVFTRKPLPEGTVVVSCPFKSSISPYGDFPLDSPCISALAKLRLKDNVLHVVLRLMAEAVRPSSPWLPWLRACPHMPDHFFNGSALGNLFDAREVTPIGSVSASWTELSQHLRDVEVKRRWEEAQEVMQRYPEHWPQGHATFALFCECLALVLSRNFHREEVHGREGPYLLPGVDLTNHSCTANVRMELRGGGRKNPTNFCLIASRALRQREQIFCSYGKIGVARFAIEFQFVTEDVVKEDTLRFSTDVITDMIECLVKDASDLLPYKISSDTIRARIERLQRLGFLFDEGLFVSRLPSPLPSGGSGGDAVPSVVAKEVQMLFNVMYLMTTNPEEFEHLIHTINRDWRVERTGRLVKLVEKVLMLRVEAARLQQSLAEQILTKAEDAGRKKLLQVTLNSELEMLQLLQEHIVQDASVPFSRGELNHV
ncbi:SET domain [Trypanosoma vivax]|uniref:SET domain-containing protein n=1 Tax=Trypanosoma vivax (strain Y486) TaxID=1055687 RepID=F9WVA1_TRYVY|nr:hypothetical protein TRVL_00446 [Trypanosoma vivax]KAH8620439.1 SET domain [Trypanosoma vivax]CCD21507.1 hypothetical protein, conserved [Trypanosoma vivax Y486]|eukprot:CCD21507.1 hypothetical protein, conserved [Trypanosoma vivax Y486]